MNNDKKFRFGFLRWDEELEFHLVQNWYDGPFWDLAIGTFWMVWNLDGLPRIFQ